jgi:hypothetical protein
MTVAAVEFHAQVTERINTKTDYTLGEARAEVAAEALSPVNGVVAAVLIVAVEVVVTQQHIQAAVFNKTLGVSLVRDERCCACQLGSARSNCQGDCAPLHHSHRDLLLWFLRRVAAFPPVFLSGRLFLFVSAQTYITQTMLAIVAILSFRYLYGRVANVGYRCRIHACVHDETSQLRQYFLKA